MGAAVGLLAVLGGARGQPWLVSSNPLVRGAGGRIREVWVDVRRRCSAREAFEGDCSWAEELVIGVRDLVFALCVYVAPLESGAVTRAGPVRRVGSGAEKLQGVRVRL